MAYKEPEQKRVYNARYQKRNREEIRAYRRQYYIRNREYYLAAHTFNKHGLRPEQWAAMWTAQAGRCYLCGEQMIKTGRTGAQVDHDHAHCAPGKSCQVCQRGLACMDCNIAVGHARDNPARLRRMADALEAAQQAVEQRKAEDTVQQLPLFETDKGG